ncbi:MAG TPA: energy transducer TonB [Rhizomicrobium sp.]|jgi:protein TonB
MERPSHILFARHSSLSRAPLVGLAIGLQLAGFWLFAHGLKDQVLKLVPGVIHLDPIEPQVMPRTPPPPLPPMQQVEPVKVPLPPIEYSRGGDPGPTFGPSNPPQPPTPPTSTGVDRAAISIAGTHTVPPYPVVERRLGIEGTVTLRLTVGTEGQVMAAEVVKSAGRDALDQVARAWIIGHWRYRPALKDGNPAVMQVLANVTYSLKSQP